MCLSRETPAGFDFETWKTLDQVPLWQRSFAFPEEQSARSSSLRSQPLQPSLRWEPRRQRPTRSSGGRGSRRTRRSWSSSTFPTSPSPSATRRLPLKPPRYISEAAPSLYLSTFLFFWFAIRFPPFVIGKIVSFGRFSFLFKKGKKKHW